MRCSSCGTELIAGKLFCHACGSRVVQACPNCGVTVQAGFRFCADCGYQLATEAGEPALARASAAKVAEDKPDDRLARLARHVPEELAQKILASKGVATGERKRVTVLFCDLVGSTAIAERLDPEEYHELLEQYLALAFREIYRFEGIVNQMAGDGFMALFGAPLAHEDAPQRAVHAALAIREALEQLNETVRRRQGIELKLRVGVHTGPVVVGTVGNDFKMDYTAIGDTTNLASRLQSLAEPGVILVSEATHRLIRGFFEIQPAGTFAVKGKSAAVSVYAVAGRREAATPMAVARARGLTPLVGRNAELNHLSACYERLADHLGQVVAVVGEAGCGKSRILYEFRQRLEGDEVTFFDGRCSSLTQMQPYAPWVSMLRRFFGISQNDRRACEQVADYVRDLGAPVDRVAPYLCYMLSLPVEGLAGVSADELKRGEFEAMARLVGALSHRGRVIIFFEDLHWIDDASREMLELAAGRIEGARVMLVVSHRPDYQPSWRTRAAFTQLSLRRLPDTDIREICRAIAGGILPGELEELIFAKAEGNPFFAEEIARALLEEGDIVKGEGGLRLSRPADQIRIPGTVEEVIGARVDRFGPQSKRVLQVAAVLGRQFRRDQLARLLEGEGIEVESQLEELERLGVIHRKAVLSDDEFRFGESLTQQVAYESLLLKERRQLHERIARALEAENAEPSAEAAALLAHHFSQSDDRGKAIDALLHAGRQAEQLPSYRTAVDLYRRAWQLAEATLDEGASREQQRRAIEVAYGLCRMTVVYASDDNTADSERAAQRCGELAASMKDGESLAGFHVLHGMVIMGGEKSRFAEGLALAEKGLAIARQSGFSDTLANVSRGIAWSYMLDGRFRAAQEMADSGVDYLASSGHAERLSDLYLGSRWMRDALYFFCEDFEGGFQGASATYELAVRAGNRTIQSGCAGLVGWVHLLRGDYAEARRWADRGLETAETIGNLSASRTAAMVALVARVELGEPSSTSRHLELIEQGLTARGDLALKLHFAVEAYLGVGEVKRALRIAELAEAHAGGRLRQAICTTALADVMRRLGGEHTGEALRRYQEAIQLAQDIGSRSTLAHAHLGAAELQATRGDRDGAGRHLETALQLFRLLGLGHYLRRAEGLRQRLSAEALASA
jgi:class 3 adenylate cyclase